MACYLMLKGGLKNSEKILEYQIVPLLLREGLFFSPHVTSTSFV